MISLLCEATCSCCGRAIKYKVDVDSIGSSVFGVSIPPPMHWDRTNWSASGKTGFGEVCDHCIFAGKVPRLAGKVLPKPDLG